jgi:hypothetical protein
VEQRKSSRRLLRQRVAVDCPRAATIAAYTRDLSLGGMFVETGALALSPNTTVSVSFSLDYGGAVHTFRLDAAVVRRSHDGMGLMFLEMEPEEIRALSEALARFH